ncbi:glycosyltransferase family 4 protein [Salinisphaera sp. RV14]|uniref:glycosyltransferase family 4 protein n=1 Tax=unclassified Salinisphaera TaxID=2649847 RepID=UPI003F844E90
MSQRPIRVALVTTLYPNAEQPHHGVFVEERLRALVATGAIDVRVIAPVPWFFSSHPRFGGYARLAAVPRQEVRHGIQIEHPRYVVIPKIGMTVAPYTLSLTIGRALSRLRRDGFDFDLIDAHYVYPDGVAAVMAGSRFRRPVVITARGTDINVIASMPGPWRQIRRAVDGAGALIAVSRALGDCMADTLGIDRQRIAALRNGVDLLRFRPGDRAALRHSLGLSGQVWLCVGRLTESKGMHIAIDALAEIPDAMLLLIGQGEDEAALKAQAERLGVAPRVRFVGAVRHDDLPGYFAAADVLMHAADREGMPNVLLEALACGCPIIATPVGGIPEIMTGLPAGYLMASRDAGAMAECWRRLKAVGTLDERGRAARRRYAEQFGWTPTTRGQLTIFSRLTGIALDGCGVDDTGSGTP